MANGPEQLRAPSSSAEGREDEQLQRAAFALDSRRPNEAERIAGEVLAANPRHARALYLLGCALVMQNRGQDAITPLETAARSRHDPEIETMLGIALRQAGQQQGALRRFMRACKRRPPYAAAFHEMGCLLVSMERYDAAIETFRNGLEAAPMMPELSIQLGYALLWRRNCAEAKHAFTRALEISPHSADALFGMGKAHQEIGESEAAAGYFRRALVSRPDDVGAWLALGLCLLELGQHDAGQDCLRRAARGHRKHYDHALNSLVASGRGRFWLKPSAAARYFQVTSN